MCWNFLRYQWGVENKIHLLSSFPGVYSFVNIWQRLYLLCFFQSSGQKEKKKKKKEDVGLAAFYADFICDSFLSS